jgi:hypothetical protein
MGIKYHINPKVKFYDTIKKCMENRDYIIPEYIDSISHSENGKWIFVKFNSKIAYNKGHKKLKEELDDMISKYYRITTIEMDNGKTAIMNNNKGLRLYQKFYGKFAIVNNIGNVVSFQIFDNGINEDTLELVSEIYEKLVEDYKEKIRR